MIVDGHTKMYSSNGPLNKLHVPIGIHLASIQYKNVYFFFVQHNKEWHLLLVQIPIGPEIQFFFPFNTNVSIHIELFLFFQKCFIDKLQKNCHNLQLM